MLRFWVAFIAICCITKTVLAQYKPVARRQPVTGEIPVYNAGAFAKEGAKYILMNDIESEGSTVFLGKNVELDLNGHTIYYAKGNYNHILNGGFEEGVTGWDISKAPGAAVVNTADVHVFLGKKLMRLQPGDIVTSPYVYLPVANRSYFAMVGITGRHSVELKVKDGKSNEMRISIYVEDESGKEVIVYTRYGDSTWLSCPVENRAPRLGGGFIYAHLQGLPAGKYRVKVKAETDCLIDEVDIRPAMDVGIGVVDKTLPLAHYDHLTDEWYAPNIPAFFDYTQDSKLRTPLSFITRAAGEGRVIIRNGIIAAGIDGIQSWGIQSTASEVKVELQNLNIRAGGISAGAADMSWADIRDCRFDVTMPFVVQRHISVCAVGIRGKNPAHVQRSEFYGGQGCLTVRGKHSRVHDNLFVNEQTVTNHYSIMGTGDSSKIYNNRFEPREGSGIYVSKYTEVFDNLFKVESADPTCEYGKEEYSVAAIRMGDYGAAPGSPKASLGNRIYRNKIIIKAKEHSGAQQYLPMVFGIYYSASGGQNYVYDNDIRVEKLNPDSKTVTAAFYICGGPKYFGGEFYNNTITSNVPAAWVATMYGGASQSKLYNNTFKLINGTKQLATINMGYQNCKSCYANEVEFHSNTVESGKFSISQTNQPHSYKVYWTYKLQLLNNKNRPVPHQQVLIRNSSNEIVARLTADADGWVATELLSEEKKPEGLPVALTYKVEVAGRVKQIQLTKNTSDKIKITQHD